METLSPYGLSHLLSGGSSVVLGVVVLLLAMSLATWYVIAAKVWQHRRLRRAATLFEQRLRTARSFEALATVLEQRSAQDAFARLACDGLDAAVRFHRCAGPSEREDAHCSEFITRALRGGIGREAARLESGLTLLASTSSTAPFIGLFGTVWGIYHALVGIGVGGQTTLEAVAGPVGEALIVTALGLAVAIPAALAYNFAVRANRLVLARLDGLAHDLHAFLVMGVPFGDRPTTASVAPRPASVAEPLSVN